MRLTERLRTRKTSGAPAGEGPTVTVGTDGEAVIDLRDPTAGPGGGPSANQAVVACPNCGGAARLDHVDDVGRVQQHRCPDCGFTFHRRTAPRS